MDHAERLLNRIRRDGIRPRPRSRILLARTFRFLLVCLLVAAGSVSVALAFGEFLPRRGQGWIFRENLSRFAPWTWLATAVLFSWSGFAVFRELPRAWRLRPLLVWGAILSISLGLGGAMHSTDALFGLHRWVARSNPPYRQAWQRRALEVWNDPAAGRLGGSLRTDAHGSPVLQDPVGREWILLWNGETPLPPGTIRLRGSICGRDTFRVGSWLPAPGGRSDAPR